MVYVNSTAIRAVDYSETTLHLRVEFHGSGWYTYYSVPKWKYLEMIGAGSVGTYFNLNIRDQHSINRG